MNKIDIFIYLEVQLTQRQKMNYLDYLKMEPKTTHLNFEFTENTLNLNEFGKALNQYSDAFHNTLRHIYTQKHLIKTNNNPEEKELEHIKTSKKAFMWNPLIEGWGTEHLLNSFNSMLEKMDKEPYQAKLEVILSVDSEYKFEAKDNGLGIDKEVENYLFRKVLHNRGKMNSTRFHGGLGQHLLNLEYGLERYEGSRGFQNYGYFKGAMFWFSIPVENMTKFEL